MSLAMKWAVAQAERFTPNQKLQVSLSLPTMMLRLFRKTGISLNRIPKETDYYSLEGTHNFLSLETSQGSHKISIQDLFIPS